MNMKAPIRTAGAGPRPSSNLRYLRAGALAMAILLIVFAAFFSWDMWETEKTREFERLRATAEVESRAIESYFKRHERNLESLRDDIYDSNGSLIPREKLQAILRKAQQADPDRAVVAVNDLEGNIIASSHGTPAVRAPVAADWRGSIEALRQGANMSIGHANISRVTRQWVFPLRVGMRDREGKLANVVIAILPLTRPISFWEGTDFPPGGGIGIMQVADAVYLLARHPLPPNADLKEIYGKPRPGEFAQLLMRGNLPASGTYDGRAALTGAPALWGYARLTNYPLVMFVQSPTALLRDRWWARVWPTYSLLVLLLLSGYLIYRWIERQRRASSAAALEATRRLRESEAGLREAQQIAKLGSWELGLASGKLHWSDEIFRIFEIDPAKFGASYEAFLAAIHPDDREAVNKAYTDSLATRAPYEIVHRLIMADGRIKHVQERCESEFDASGKPLRSVGTVQDITDRWEAEERLRISLAEKETLLREIHHRVKNNLQIISSLLHFQSRKAKGAENLAVFQEGRDRLKSMILVHEKLYQSQNLSRIEFGDYARSLLEEIGVSYRDSAKAMTLKVEAVAVYLPIETALPLGMLLSELATNVFKYAYPDGRGGELRVTVAGADGQLQLVVADDGAGLPERVNPEAPESFGLRLVANLATQLGGSVRYARGAGLSVEVRVPLANAQDGAEERAA